MPTAAAAGVSAPTDRKAATKYGGEVHGWFGSDGLPLHAIFTLLQGRDDKALYPGGVRDGVFNGGFLEVIANPSLPVVIFGRFDFVRNRDQALPTVARDFNDQTAYSYVPYSVASGGPDASSAAALNAFLSIPGNTPVLFYPNFVDEYHSTIAAGLTLPVTKDLNLGFAYNTQTYHGAYGTTISQNISQRKDMYDATLIYNIPKTTSSIGVLFRNQKYTDAVIPTYNFNQNREDLNFSIRF